MLTAAALMAVNEVRKRDPVGALIGRGKRDAKDRSAAAKQKPGTREGDARGRGADKPTDIPAPGWKDILWRVYEEFSRDRVLSVAAGVTFYGLLALFPAVAALVSLYGLVADASTINEHLAVLSGFLPGGATEIIGDQVKRLTAKGGGALGFAFFSGLAISLWSANAGVKAMFDALNIVYEEQEKRSFISLNLRSLAFTLAAILFAVIALTAIVVVPVILNFIGMGGPVVTWLISLARWPVLLVVVSLGLSMLYRFGPSRDEPKWRWVTPGSLVASVLWLVTSMLFSWYVANFGNYNETYGSLGAAIGFMTWIWISTTIILVGGELNAEIEHQTTKDTTEGPPKPLGVRRAKMADTVGAASS